MKKPLGKTFKVYWACGGDVNNRNTDDSLRLIAETIKLPSKYICPIGLVDTYRGFSLRPLKQQIPLQSAIISRITKGLEKHRSDYLPTKTEFEITLKKANLPRYRGGLRKRLTNWPATNTRYPGTNEPSNTGTCYSHPNSSPTVSTNCQHQIGHCTLSRRSTRSLSTTGKRVRRQRQKPALHSEYG